MAKIITPASVEAGDQLQLIYVKVKDLSKWDRNPKKHDLPSIKQSFIKYGFKDPPKWENVLGGLVEGNGRFEALTEMEAEGGEPPRGILKAKDTGDWCAPVLVGVEAESKASAEAYAIDHNNLVMVGSGFSDLEIAELWIGEDYAAIIKDVVENGEEFASISDEGLRDIEKLFGEPEEEFDGEAVRGKLHERFVAPPFSVLDARQGYWQDRKREWLSLGIRGEEGRGEGATGSMNSVNIAKYGREEEPSTSIFDPVLCELMYLWFSPHGGNVLDPFAGGSVRGVVAGIKGRSYTGVDLSAKQVEANEEQAREVIKEDGEKPKWIIGDSLDMPNLIGDQAFDFVFSCPPYGDLEQYSEDPKDLSNQGVSEFDKNYADIIDLACKRLKKNRFACFVVGDYRNKDGTYRNFVSSTIEAFLSAGLSLYNEAILVTALGSLPIRATKTFMGGRKLGKTHQNVLVFVKGDWKKAHEACGDLGDFGEIFDD